MDKLRTEAKPLGRVGWQAEAVGSVGTEKRRSRKCVIKCLRRIWPELFIEYRRYANLLDTCYGDGGSVNPIIWVEFVWQYDGHGCYLLEPMWVCYEDDTIQYIRKQDKGRWVLRGGTVRSHR